MGKAVKSKAQQAKGDAVEPAVDAALQEWGDAFAAIIQREGVERAHEVLRRLAAELDTQAAPAAARGSLPEPGITPLPVAACPACGKPSTLLADAMQFAWLAGGEAVRTVCPHCSAPYEVWGDGSATLRDEPGQAKVIQPLPEAGTPVYDEPMPKTRTTQTTHAVAGELTQRKRPSHQPGYARNNRAGLVGLGVEVPLALRAQVQQAADDCGMTKQEFVTQLLTAAMAEDFRGKTISVPDAFKKERTRARKALALMVRSLRR